MDTPIADFIKKYLNDSTVRMHMPGHKGRSFLGCENFDITEIKGADSLYEADGIIAQSERNAAQIFGAARTLFSAEGSSQCIRAMVHLAVANRSEKMSPAILAARNAHKSFVYACALCDVDVEWLMPEHDGSLCSCDVSEASLEKALLKMHEIPCAVYVTSPDYLGNMLDIGALAKVCHKYGTLLLVDNAHGAYLHFLETPCHPMDLGADICCDSVHKTLPGLTGSAYLHINSCAPAVIGENAKCAMSVYGSTSPSYLVLASLDLCNAYLCEGYAEKLNMCIKTVAEEKARIVKNGWQLVDSDPLKITVKAPSGMTGIEIGERLRSEGIECEYSDPDFTVLMLTPENDGSEIRSLSEALGANHLPYAACSAVMPVKAEKAMSLREAVFSPSETVKAAESIGRICASPTVSCPPAIPIVVSGERVTPEAIKLFGYYGTETVNVVK